MDTGKLTFFCVNALVFHEVGFHHKRCIALDTRKGTLSFVVGEDVFHEALFLHEGCIAVDAGKWALPRANAHEDIDGIFP